MKTYSLKLDDTLFKQLKEVTDITKDSFASFIRSAIALKIEKEKQSLSFRLNNITKLDPKESKEIMDGLNALSDDDLSISSKVNIKL
ncbi:MULTISPECIES: hypothetical protein [unclassified Campylobacter]|uniref:hypothetical protein n=1 Tax=unclassified Campylobacter TaxID=2593542 RepID=UPI003D33E89F